MLTRFHPTCLKTSSSNDCPSYPSSSSEVDKRNCHPSGAFSSVSGQWVKIWFYPVVLLSGVNFLSYLNNFNNFLISMALSTCFVLPIIYIQARVEMWRHTCTGLWKFPHGVTDRAYQLTGQPHVDVFPFLIHNTTVIHLFLRRMVDFSTFLV